MPHVDASRETMPAAALSRMFQHKLEELRQQFSTLQQFSHRDPGQVRELLPGVLAGLQRSLEELQTIVQSFRRRAHGLGRARAEQRKAFEGCSARPRAALPRHGRAGPGPGPDHGHRNALPVGQPGLARVHGTEHEAAARGGLARRTCTPRIATAAPGSATKPSIRADSIRVEYRLQRKNGEYGWVLEIGTPRLTSRGSVGGYLGTAIEITEHKQAETRLALQYAVARVLSEAKTLEEAAGPDPADPVREPGLGCRRAVVRRTRRRARPHCAQLWASPSVDVSGLQEGPRTRVFPPGRWPAVAERRARSGSPTSRWTRPSRANPKPSGSGCAGCSACPSRCTAKSAPSCGSSAAGSARRTTPWWSS